MYAAVCYLVLVKFNGSAVHALCSYACAYSGSLLSEQQRQSLERELDSANQSSSPQTFIISIVPALGLILNFLEYFRVNPSSRCIDSKGIRLG